MNATKKRPLEWEGNRWLQDYLNDTVPQPVLVPVQELSLAEEPKKHGLQDYLNYKGKKP